MWLRLAVLAVLASCTPTDSDQWTVNAETWHIEFDATFLDGAFAPRDQRPSELVQPTCDPGCTCRFEIAQDYYDSYASPGPRTYATSGYYEVCNPLNVEVSCTIDFESNTNTDGGCQFSSITRPGFDEFVMMHLRAL